MYGSDIRPETKEQVQSLGGKFIEVEEIVLSKLKEDM